MEIMSFFFLDFSILFLWVLVLVKAALIMGDNNYFLELMEFIKQPDLTTQRRRFRKNLLTTTWYYNSIVPAQSFVNKKILKSFPESGVGTVDS